MFGIFNFWLPLVLIIQVYWFLPSKKWRNLCLLISSWGFYITVSWKMFPFLLISTATDYIAGFLVVPEQKKYLRFIGIISSLTINLGLLLSFKYIPELSQSSSEFISVLKSIGLPLGISFYTFQTIGYTLDCYKGHIKPCSDIISFAVYVSFFPQIAAGPIEKAGNLLPQLQNYKKQIDTQRFKEGFYLILLGLFKKIYVAGAVSHPLNMIYNSDNPTPSLALLSGLLAIIHVYVDFSSYSDLARGIAKFFGIDLMINFKPFVFSTNPQEYWKRWHISLYMWIQDYLKQPIRETIKNTYLLYFVIFITFALWHQISITWFLLGVFNGVAVSINRYLNKTNFSKIGPRALRFFLSVFCMLFFHSINGWLYKSDNLEILFKILTAVSQFKGFGRESFDLIFYLLPFLLPLFIYEYFQHKYDTELFILKTPFLIRAFWIAFVLVSIFIFERNSEQTFIYFGF